MWHRYNGFILIIFIGCFTNYHLAFSAILEGTLISSSRGLIAIEDLSLSDTILSANAQFKINAVGITHLFSQKATHIYAITTAQSTFYVSKNQLIYDATAKKWSFPENLNTSTTFINCYGTIIPYQSSQIIVKECVVHELSLQHPHTFFISEEQILVHNFIPCAIGLSFAFGWGEGIALSGIGFSLGTLGVGIWKWLTDSYHEDPFYKDNIKNTYCSSTYQKNNEKIYKTPASHPQEFIRLKNGQGFKDKDGNIWKRDMKHRVNDSEHWDVSDRRGRPVREVSYDGREIWPNGPKNKGN